MTASKGDNAAAQLRQMVDEIASENDVSEMAAVRMLGDELAQVEREAVAHARDNGATWQRVADELGLTTRQGAQTRFGGEEQMPLPGMSATAMAARLGIHPQTVANNPGGHGVVVKTYPAKAGGRGRKRYFLPGDEGSGTVTD